MEFKDRIKILRKDKAISAAVLAETLGKKESTVRMWEAGKAKPDADTLIKISKMFGYSTDYLLGFCKIKKPENIEIYDSLGLTDEAIARIREFKGIKTVPLLERYQQEENPNDDRTLLDVLNIFLSCNGSKLFLSAMKIVSKREKTITMTDDEENDYMPDLTLYYSVKGVLDYTVRNLEEEMDEKTLDFLYGPFEEI